MSILTAIGWLTLGACLGVIIAALLFAARDNTPEDDV
jgi:hypothetical protein